MERQNIYEDFAKISIFALSPIPTHGRVDHNGAKFWRLKAGAAKTSDIKIKVTYS